MPSPHALPWRPLTVLAWSPRQKEAAVLPPGLRSGRYANRSQAPCCRHSFRGSSNPPVCSQIRPPPIVWPWGLALCSLWQRTRQACCNQGEMRSRWLPVCIASSSRVFYLGKRGTHLGRILRTCHDVCGIVRNIPSSRSLCCRLACCAVTASVLADSYPQGVLRRGSNEPLVDDSCVCSMSASMGCMCGVCIRNGRMDGTLSTCKKPQILPGCTREGNYVAGEAYSDRDAVLRRLHNNHCRLSDIG